MHVMQVRGDGLLQHGNAGSLVLLLRQVHQRTENAVHIYALSPYLLRGLCVVLLTLLALDLIKF